MGTHIISILSCNEIYGVKSCGLGEELINCPEDIREGTTENMELEQDAERS